MGLFARARRGSNASRSQAIVHPDRSGALQDLLTQSTKYHGTTALSRRRSDSDEDDDEADADHKGSSTSSIAAESDHPQNAASVSMGGRRNILRRFKRQMSNSASEVSIRSGLGSLHSDSNQSLHANRDLEIYYCSKFDVTEFSILRSKQRIELFEKFAEDVKQQPVMLQRVSILASLCKLFDRISAQTSHAMIRPAVEAIDTLLSSNTPILETFLTDVARLGSFPFIAARWGAAAIAQATPSSPHEDPLHAQAWLYVALAWLSVMATLVKCSKAVREILATADNFDFAFQTVDRACRTRFDSGPEALRVRERADLCLMQFCAAITQERHAVEVLAARAEGGYISALAFRAAQLGFNKYPQQVDAAALALARIAASGVDVAFTSGSTVSRDLAEALLKILNTELGPALDELLTRDDIELQRREDLEHAGLKEPNRYAEVNDPSEHARQEQVGNTNGEDNNHDNHDKGYNKDTTKQLNQKRNTRSLFATEAGPGSNGRSMNPNVSAFLDFVKATLAIDTDALLMAGATVADAHGTAANAQGLARVEGLEGIDARLYQLKARTMRDPALRENAAAHFWLHLLRVEQLWRKNASLINNSNLPSESFLELLQGTSRNFYPCVSAHEIVQAVFLLQRQPDTLPMTPALTSSYHARTISLEPVSSNKVPALLRLCEQLMVKSHQLQHPANVIRELIPQLYELLARQPGLDSDAYDITARIIDRIGSLSTEILEEVVTPIIVDIAKVVQDRSLCWVMFDYLFQELFVKERSDAIQWCKCLLRGGLLGVVTPQLDLEQPDVSILLQFIYSSTELMCLSTAKVAQLQISNTQYQEIATSTYSALRAASTDICLVLFELCKEPQSKASNEIASVDDLATGALDARAQRLQSEASLYQLSVHVLELESASTRYNEIMERSATLSNIETLARALLTRVELFQGTDALKYHVPSLEDTLIGGMYAIIHWIAHLANTSEFAQAGSSRIIRELIDIGLALIQEESFSRDLSTNRNLLFILFRSLRFSKINLILVPSLQEPNQCRNIANCLIHSLFIEVPSRRPTPPGSPSDITQLEAPLSVRSPTPRAAAKETDTETKTRPEQHMFAALTLLHLSQGSEDFCNVLSSLRRLASIPNAVLHALGGAPFSDETRSLQLSLAGVLFNLLSNQTAKRVLDNLECIETIVQVVQKHCALAQEFAGNDVFVPSEGMVFFLGVIGKIAQQLEKHNHVLEEPKQKNFHQHRGVQNKIQGYRSQYRAMRSLLPDLFVLQSSLHTIKLGKHTMVVQQNGEAPDHITDLAIAAKHAVTELLSMAPAVEPSKLDTKRFQLLLNRAPPGLYTIETLRQLQNARLAQFEERPSGMQGSKAQREVKAVDNFAPVETILQAQDQWTRAFYESLLQRPEIRAEFLACEAAAREKASKASRLILKDARTQMGLNHRPTHKDQPQFLERDLGAFFRENILTKGLIDMPEEDRLRFDLAHICASDAHLPELC